MGSLAFRQAIGTRYFGPSNVRGSRIKARCEAGSLTLSWDSALGVVENHAKVARALANKLDWSKHGRMIGGGSPDGRGYVFTFYDDEDAVVPMTL